LASQKHRVLLVDDEQDITAVLKRMLEAKGYSVDAYNEPETALSLFKPNFYDIILLDIKMPRMSGFQLSRSIWQKQPNARICFFSAFEIYQKEAMLVFKNMQEYCFIKKPIPIAELVGHIERRLSTGQFSNLGTPSR
jgi:DNA-binding response OmpR family regulator